MNYKGFISGILVVAATVTATSVLAEGHMHPRPEPISFESLDTNGDGSITMEEMEATINELMAAITGRFENFERGTKNMWDKISVKRFRRVEQLISSYHTTIGGVLCSLSVKMDAWARLFPTPSVGGPGKRAEFIMSEMKQGMEKIQTIEDSAPMLSALN